MEQVLKMIGFLGIIASAFIFKVAFETKPMNFFMLGIAIGAVI